MFFGLRETTQCSRLQLVEASRPEPSSLHPSLHPGGKYYTPPTCVSYEKIWNFPFRNALYNRLHHP